MNQNLRFQAVANLVRLTADPEIQYLAEQVGRAFKIVAKTARAVQMP